MIQERSKYSESSSGNFEALEQNFYYEANYETKKGLEQWVRSVVEDDQILLSNTGFNVAANIAQYIYLNRLGKREAYHDLTCKDTLGHTAEFSLGDPIIKYEVTRDVVNGEPTLLTKDYVSGEYIPLLSLLNPNERNGSVVRRTRLLADLIAKAHPGTFFTITSPDGWHGLTDSNSVPYTEYNHSQTAFIEVKEDGILNAYTIRSSMTLEQNEEFLSCISRGKYKPKGETYHITERITDLVDTVVEAPEIRSLEEVLEKISEIRQSDTFWHNVKYTGEHVRFWTSEEVKGHIPHIKSTEYLKADISHVLDKFWNNVEADIQGESVDEIRLLASYVRDAVLESSFEARKRYLDEEISYSIATETAHNEGQSGCVSSVSSEFGNRSVTEIAVMLGIDYPFDRRGTCRSKHRCMSGSNGEGKMIAVCGFCLECDVALRIGTLNISDIPKEEPLTSNGDTQEDKTVSLTYTLGLLFIHLFSN